MSWSIRKFQALCGKNVPLYNEEKRWNFDAGNIRYLIRESIDGNTLNGGEELPNGKNAYIIFVDHDYDLDWEIHDNDANGNYYVDTQEPLLGKVLSRISQLETIPSKQQGSDVQIQYKKMLGEALVLAFKSDYDTANKTLDDAFAYINARNAEQSRIWQIVACVLVFIPLSIGSYSIFNDAIISIESYESLLNLAEKMSSCELAYTAFISGTMGAILSIIMQMGKLNLSSESSKLLHFLEIFCRIFAGGAMAVVAMLMVISKILLNTFADTIGIFLTVVLLGLVSGISERLVPNMLKETMKLKN